MKNILLVLTCTLMHSFSFGQIKNAGVTIINDAQQAGVNLSNTKRSLQNPKSCTQDTVEYPLVKASTLPTISIAKGRSLGQLYSCPKPVTISGFTFYAFVLPMHKTSKKMDIYCRLYKAGPDSLPSGQPLRADTVSIDSTLGIGLLSSIVKYANFAAITMDSNYIITVETNDDSLTAGVVTNNYANRDGERENLNCGSISGLWYNGRNLNVGGAPFDCDVLLHPYVKYIFGTDFSIKNNCYNINDSIKFINASPSNMLGSRMYNRYFYYGSGWFCNLWDMGNNQGGTYTIDNIIKYSAKMNYKVRLISTIYGYKGPMYYGCRDTAIKILYYKPDIPTFSGAVNVCIGDTAKYTAVTADTGVVFEWLMKPNSPSPFFTGKVYKKFPVTKNDTFYLRANNNGCISGLRTIIIRANAYPVSLNTLDDSVCAGSKANLKAVSNIGNSLWYTSATGGLPIYNGQIYQTGILSKDTFFYVEANNSGCIMSPRIKVSAFVGSNFAPTAPILSNDTVVCLSAGNLLTLTAAAGSGLSVRWYNAASGGSSIHTGNTFDFLPTKKEVKTFYADAYNGICGSTRVPINITVEDFPVLSNLLGDTICKGDSARMRFSLPFGDADWYDAASGGNYITSGTYLATFPGSTSDYYIETKSGICIQPNRVKVTAIVNTFPTVLKLWGDTICSKNFATLKSKLSGPGTMEWYDSDTSTPILKTGNTFQTPVLNGSRKYYARPVYAGCAGPRASVQPLVKPSPFSGFSFEVLTWQQVRVSPINASGSSVKWDFGDGTTSNNSNVTHRYTNTGTYQIKLILTSPVTGCKDSTTVTVQIDPSSINSIYESSQLKLYPNPVLSTLRIEMEEDINERLLEIYDLKGVLVYTMELNSEGAKAGIDLKVLDAGIYILKVQGYKPALFVKQ